MVTREINSLGRLSTSFTRTVRPRMHFASLSSLKSDLFLYTRTFRWKKQSHIYLFTNRFSLFARLICNLKYQFPFFFNISLSVLSRLCFYGFWIFLNLLLLCRFNFFSFLVLFIIVNFFLLGQHSLCSKFKMISLIFVFIFFIDETRNFICMHLNNQEL